MPKSFAFLFSSEATIGDIVLESMMSESFFAFLNKPFYDSHTYIECWELGTIVTKISA